MSAHAVPASQLQKAIDWLVFGIGCLALSTAIAATVTGPDRNELANAAPPVQTPLG